MTSASASRSRAPAPAGTSAPLRGSAGPLPHKAAPSEVELPPPATLGWLGAPAALLSFGVTLSRAASGAQHASDVASLRDLALLGFGPGGHVSRLLTQGASLVPLGGKPFRAALVQATALGCASWLLALWTSALLASVFPSRTRAPLLGAVAAMVVSLAPTWQAEGTLGGGAMVAVALALACLHAARSWHDQPRGSAAAAARLPLLGLALGALAAESPSTALLLSVCLLPALASGGGRGGLALLARLTRRVPGRGGTLARGTAEGSGLHGLGTALGVAGLTALLLAAPSWLRALSGRPWTELTRGLAAAGLDLSPLAARVPLPEALPSYLHEVGLVALAAGAFGAGFALLRGRGGRWLLPLGGLVLADLCVRVTTQQELWIEMRPLRCLALAALALGTALGVHVACGWMREARLPGARPAEALTVAFHLTLAALASEEASFLADRSQRSGAEEWTDLALARLEPGAALLVESPEPALRLLAARLVRGERPDLLLLPTPFLQTGGLRRTVSEQEPTSAGLLRDLALSGRPSEFGLSALADERPLYLEVQPPWSGTLLSHLSLDGPWARYSPQPIGRSDRKVLAGASMVAGAARVLRASRAVESQDEPADELVIGTLRAEVRTLVQLGDLEKAQGLVAEASALAPGDPRLGADAFAPFLVPLPRFPHPRVAASGAHERKR